MKLGHLSDELVALAGDAVPALAMSAAAEMRRRADAATAAVNEALRRSGGKLDTPLRDLTDSRWRAN